jgi:hypothetical protein
MKIKCLRGFVSSILTMEEGEVKEIELDAPTFEYWTSNGLIEEVKVILEEAVESNGNAQDTAAPSPEVVTTDENE